METILIGHFRVPKNLTFKTRLSAKPLYVSFICIIIKNHFHINGFALSLAFKVRFLELGNGLLLLSVDILSYSGINPHSVAILHEQTVTVASYE